MTRDLFIYALSGIAFSMDFMRNRKRGMMRTYNTKYRTEIIYSIEDDTIRDRE